MIPLREFVVRDTLRNGVAATIRALRSDDRERIARAVRHLDRETIYTRLFSYRKELTEAGLDRIMTFDPKCDVLLIVTTVVGAEEIVIGSGRYVAAPDLRTAEVAFVVEEDYQGLGIAQRLLRHLAAFARAGGIETFEADILTGNKAMFGVFARSGLEMRKHPEGGSSHVTLALRGGA